MLGVSSNEYLCIHAMYSAWMTGFSFTIASGMIPKLSPVEPPSLSVFKPQATRHRHHHFSLYPKLRLPLTTRIWSRGLNLSQLSLHNWRQSSVERHYPELNLPVSNCWSLKNLDNEKALLTKLSGEVFVAPPLDRCRVGWGEGVIIYY